jgi:hypothetical protein
MNPFQKWSISNAVFDTVQERYYFTPFTPPVHKKPALASRKIFSADFPGKSVQKSENRIV